MVFNRLNDIVLGTGHDETGIELLRREVELS